MEINSSSTNPRPTRKNDMREEISSEPCILERDQNGIIRIKHCEELFIADRESFQKLLDERNNFLIHRDKLIANLQIMKTPKTNTHCWVRVVNRPV